MNPSDVFDGVDQLLPRLGEVYRDLHRHPELSMAEHRTAGMVEQALVGFGYQVQRLGGTGVVGVLENGPGRTVLARADMDALPMAEDTGLDYASMTEGAMHACGHDLHTAGLLGAAELLAGQRQAWSGAYVVVFQPGEETGEGARAMLDDGLAEAIPTPDVAIGQHVMPTAAGTVQMTTGPMLSTSTSMTITVFGRGGHGASPDLTVDPVVLASAIVLRLQTIVARETAPGQFAVVTVGALNAGTKANIIADRAELKLSLRAYDSAVLDRLVAAVERVVRGECQVAGSPREPDFDRGVTNPLTDNDPQTTAVVADAFRAHFGPEAVSEAGPYTASEDFSNLPRAVGIPYTFWAVGVSDPDEYHRAQADGSILPGPHSPEFAPAPEALDTAVRAQVVAALAFLGVGDQAHAGGV